MKKLVLILVLIAVCSTVTVGCKATRVIATTTTCTICADSTQSSATIQTKVTEDYQGVKKK